MLKKNSKLVCDSRAGFFAGAVIFAMLCHLLLAVPGRAQDSRATALSEAEKKYAAGDFDAALGLATSCLSGDQLAETEAVRIYKLLSMIHLAQNDSSRAVEAVENLLKRRPNYAPDPDQEPPSFIALVNKIKRESPPSRPAAAHSKKSLKPWIAGGVLAGVTALVVLWPLR